MAGFGFDAEVIQDVNQGAKRLGLHNNWCENLLTYQPSRMTIQVDKNKPRQGYFVVVGNARYYAGRFSITTMASIEDGLLDICIFKKSGIERVTRYVTGVLLKKHIEFQDVEYLGVGV